MLWFRVCFFFFQAEDGIRDLTVTGVQTCALPISLAAQTGAGTVVLGTYYRDGDSVRFHVQIIDAARGTVLRGVEPVGAPPRSTVRSEEHTSELQSQSNLVCRLLLEKKKKPKQRHWRQALRDPHEYMHICPSIYVSIWMLGGSDQVLLLVRSPSALIYNMYALITPLY